MHLVGFLLPLIYHGSNITIEIPEEVYKDIIGIWLDQRKDPITSLLKSHMNSWGILLIVVNYSTRDKWSLVSSKCLHNFSPNSSQLWMELEGNLLYHCKDLPLKYDTRSLTTTSSLVT